MCSRRGRRCVARASVEGLAKVREVAESSMPEAQQEKATRVDVYRARAEEEAARIGLLDAEQAYLPRKRQLALLLSLPPAEAERALEPRGTIQTSLRRRHHWRSSGGSHSAFGPMSSPGVSASDKKTCDSSSPIGTATSTCSINRTHSRTTHRLGTTE